jgi:hypothetical protein
MPPVRQGNRFVGVAETAGGAATSGDMVGKDGVTLTVGDTLIIGTAAAELTPRLPISKDPKGIPVRATPPGVMGAVEVGVDDEATLLEPEPHIPDMPAVSSIPEVVDTPDVLRILAEDETPDVDAPDIAAVPDIAALPVVPVPIPPPSKLAVDPNIDVGEVPTVEHAVPLVVLGIEIVPVTPVGTGLRPAEVISVEPSGMPVGPTDVPGLSPSGEVVPRVGVVGIAPTCAIALLQANSAESATAINANLTCALRFAVISPGARLSDIGQSPVAAHEASRAYCIAIEPKRYSWPILLLCTGRWTTRSTGSIKYAFTVLADPVAQMGGLCCSRVPAWKLKINLIEQPSFAPDVHG